MTQGDGWREDEFSDLMAPWRVMPPQKPGRSKQDYGTPPEFIRAVKKRFNIKEFDIDLAADAANTQAVRFYDEKTNALVQTWKVGNGWNWLNPPFSKIEPWVRKAWESTSLESNKDAQTLMLVPAGVGSNWWAKWVHDKAQVVLLNGRLTFVGETKPYPKDCCLLIYGERAWQGQMWTGWDEAESYRVWKWREDAGS